MSRLRDLTVASLGISHVKAEPLRGGLRPALTLLVTAVRKLTAVMTQPGKPLLSRREARRSRVCRQARMALCGAHPKRRYRQRRFAGARRGGHCPPDRADKRDMLERAARHAGLLSYARHKSLPIQATYRESSALPYVHLRIYLRRGVVGNAARHAWLYASRS